MHRRVIQLEQWHTSPSQRWVPQLGMYSLSSCTVISVVNLKSAISPQKGTPYTKSHPKHAYDQQKTLDTHILRPFRVNVVRKLLVEYHVERQLPFLAIDSPTLRRLLEYLDPRSVKH